MAFKIKSFLLLLSLIHSARPFECSPAAFSTCLLSLSAEVAYTSFISENGTFDVPVSDIAYPVSPTGLPAACVVQVNVTSSSTSAYSFGLFLPETWNERFLTVGNGGFAGGINWLDMGAGLRYGFAAMSTDGGHNSTVGDATWALNQEQKKIDFGYRAMHGSIVIAKQLIEAFYNSSSKYNYYSGCSTGGRQGLKDIQLYPEDFDGVLSGAPAWWPTHLQPWTTKIATYNLPVTSESYIPPELFPIVGTEALRQCDGSDGVVDSIISDPSRCNFNIEALLCPTNTTNQTEAGCLFSPQLDTLYKIYNDYVETNQTFVFSHLEIGSEGQWPSLLGMDAPSTLGTQFVQYFVLNDPDWPYQDIDYAIVQLADRLNPGGTNADDFDALDAFQQRGGKLLQYHGLADALIATGSSVYFYNHVLRTLAPKGLDLDDFYRLFLVPGMQHCASTPTDVNAPWYFAGANQAASLSTSLHSVPGFSDAKHDALLALMAWTENGTAPDQIIATKWVNDYIQDEVMRQRPLCVYPRQAMFVGSDVNAAESWECERLYGMKEQ